MITKAEISRFYKAVDRLGLKFPNAEIARVTGFSKGTVSDYLNKVKEPSENFIKAFYTGFESSINVPHETLLIEQPVTYLQKRANIKNGAKSGIPVFTGNTRAGTIEVYSDDPSENEPVDHLPATMFPGCNHAERVSGDSMHPILINQGYAIGKIIDKKGIIYGEKYIVHTKYGLSMVKYLQEASKKDKVKLVSYNKNIAPQEIPYDDITFCCRIYFIVNPS